MLSLVLAATFIFASPAAWSSADAAVALAMFEGEWGFTSSEPADSWFGVGFSDGAGACGAEKALNLDIREETLSDGTRLLTLRRHPNAEFGVTAVMLDVIDDDHARLTTRLFDEEELFDRNGDLLTVVRGSTRLDFERC
jgi:hypothetical protein